MRKLFVPTILSAFLVAALATGAPVLRAAELVADPGFGAATDAGKAHGWQFPNFMSPAGSQRVDAGGEAFMRFQNDDVTKVVGMEQTLSLPPGTAFVVLSVKMRTQAIKLGGEGWHEPRVSMRWTNDAGEQVGGYPQMPSLREDAGWTQRTLEMDVPAGATKLNLQPGLWLCAGTLDIDDLSVQAFPSGADYLRSKVVPFSPAFGIGTFDEVDAAGKPKGWDVPAGVTTVSAEESQRQRVDQHPENNRPGAPATPSGRVLFINGEKSDNDLRATTSFAVDSAWQELRVQLKMKAEHSVLGPEVRAPSSTKWRQAGALVTFLDASGKEMTDGAGLYVMHPRDWTDFTLEAGVPDGAIVCRIELGTWWAGGRIYYDDVRVTPITEVRVADAELSSENAAQFQQKAAREISAHRGEIDLNGLWQFVPAAGATLREPKGFGYIRVPGAWNRDGALAARGVGRNWLMFKGDEVGQAWYQRPITIPAAWKDRSVLLDLDRVSTDAVVYLDGQEVGQVNWPAGQVDLTPAMKPGVEQTLRVRVMAVDDKTEVTNYMGYLNEPKAKAQLDNRGIIGRGLKLVGRPRQGHVADVYVRPSTRLKKVDVDIELANVARAGLIRITAEMLDEQGKVERAFEGTADVREGAYQQVTVSWPWDNPRLWDYKQPNRYTMRLTIAGDAVTDAVVQPFGFREFWIDGRDFYLNGTRYNLRPNNLQYGAKPDGLIKEGYNFAELWPDDRGRRGTDLDYDDECVAQADRVGFPIAAKLVHMGDWAADIKKWEKPETKADYQRLMANAVRRWRNHPGVVMWAHSANAFQWTGDGEPRLLGQRNVSNMQEQERRRDNVLEAIAMAKKVDPVRPVYAHHGADAGEIYTSNFYLNFIPLQEREEWMAHWAKHGQMPFIAVEFGPPLYASLMRDKDGYTAQGHSEPSLTEWMAVYQGHDAYRDEEADYHKIFAERYHRSDNYRNEYHPHIRHGQYEHILTYNKSFRAFQNLFYRNTWRSWRTMGVSGMGIPWHQTDPTMFPELPANNGDTLAWIAGAPGDSGTDASTDPAVPNFTRKDHHFAPGQAVRKQIVLINDARASQAYTATWTVKIADKTVIDGKKDGQLAVGEKLFAPVDFTVPSIDGDRAEGTITLTSKIGDRQHDDVFPFTVFTAPAKSAGRLAVWDPAGDTSKMLTAMGYEVTPWTEGQPAGPVAVIGRKALSHRHVPPGDVATFVREGGRLIVFGQDNDWTRLSLQLRTAPHVSRRAFAVDAAHPVVAGLTNDNLRDWAGDGTLVIAYPHRPGSEWLDAYGWRWGNRGSVSSTPIEKPHRSSFRPILECEFDLAYSPLMEMEFGKGRVTLCTLDLEARANGQDPAAMKLAMQMMKHVTDAPIAPKVDAVAYVGGEKGAKVLDDLGVAYTKAGAIDLAAKLVVIGEGAAADNLAEFVANGGKALVLARDPGAAPAGVTVEKREKFQGSHDVPAWPEAAGLGPSDLHWKTRFDGRVLTAGPNVEIAADGMLGRMAGANGGVAIFAQVDPTYLPADEKHYFRFTRWRQTRALSQLLANLGATFKQDAAFMALLQQPEQGYMLAGPWEAQKTVTLPESLYREWHSPQPISDAARQLIASGAESSEGWQKVSVPAYLESYGPQWKWTDGETLFRKVIDVPDYMAGRDMFLSVGRVDETEETFVNGTSIGSSKSWLFPRGHKVAGHLIKPGRNVIIVRNWDEGIHGGMCGAANAIFLRSDAADAGFYHPDYLSDQVDASTTEEGWKQSYERWFIADNPYRYTRW